MEKNDKNNKIKKILRWIFFSLSLFITIFIIVNASLPGETSSKVSGEVSEVISEFTKFENNNEFEKFIRKSLGHFGLFLLNGLFLCAWLFLFSEGNKINKWWKILLIVFSFGLLLALLTETIQYFVPGRTFSYLDILIDVIGHLLGSLFSLPILILLKRNQKIGN